MVRKAHRRVFFSFDIQVKTALVNLLFNFPQLTRAKIVTRTFVPGGQKHEKTMPDATMVFVKVSSIGP